MRSGKLYPHQPLVLHTNESGRFLLPTLRANKPTGYSSKGYGETTEQAIKRLMLPTIGANEGKGAGHKRFRGSTHFRGAKTSEALRTCETDPIYLNPSFAELMMGFPVGWVCLATPLSRRSQRKLVG